MGKVNICVTTGRDLKRWQVDFKSEEDVTLKKRNESEILNLGLDSSAEVYIGNDQFGYILRFTDGCPENIVLTTEMIEAGQLPAGITLEKVDHGMDRQTAMLDAVFKQCTEGLKVIDRSGRLIECLNEYRDLIALRKKDTSGLQRALQRLQEECPALMESGNCEDRVFATTVLPLVTLFVQLSR